ncbi:immunity 8 family protein [Isoptericola sp. NEAU-Y5]|uniref:Immunity 8 family protein n=1 Tax=Isoptericola luteus TaxID=2879484 RepID=A0ABS7ZI94_9MICO|nr:Imm8 family immunity protein [Isoptericola sp. NEAU-Y5]MCA5894737.1 immunity 8 family protein [Isoptericola sp. NEAU-Y5]
MRATLRSLDFDPDPGDLPADPSAFRFNARLTVGPDDGPGDETFDVTVCTPEWLSQACRASGGIYDARHHVVVTLDQFDRRVLRDWFVRRVQGVEGDNWSRIGHRLGRLGFWEFEDYAS